MEMLSSPKNQSSESVFPGLQQRQQTSKLLAGTEPPLQKIENQASVNIGTSHHLGPSKQETQMATINKQSVQAELSMKVRAESESVRSKLRESLASALATGSKKQNKLKFIEKNYIGEEKGVLRQADVASLQSEIHSSAEDGSPCESLPNNLTSDAQIKKFDGNRGLPFEAGSSGNSGDKNEADSICDVQESYEKHDIVMDDVPFSGHSIMEDELLQVHGLFWASDFDSVNEDSMQNSALKRPKLMDFEENRDKKDASLQTSEKLSVLIEAELFKLFGGVNKKYKEKGRSLLFNLKDPSNPDLRERVLSGTISPQQLCTMTTEQLASKELSRWRQAKAEEYEHMVVLPDMNVGMRRLVKKTHKGEFQVEVEQDDGAHVDVGLGSDVFSKILAKSNDVDQSKLRSNDKEPTASKTHDSSDLDGRNVSSNFDHKLSEKTDYIQDFMVEELKDAELLPPVVSLDEFMQDLDSEPPFQNLEANNLQENPSSVNRNLDRSESESISTPDASASKLDSKIHSGHMHTKHTKETSSSNNGQVDYNYQKSVDKQKKDGVYAKHVTGITDSESKSNITWEGFLQLNVSALSNVMALFLSGERTSMKEWPSLLEVKGRVRLDAFEKFLQELPLSRSRTIMMVEFSWKEDSQESGRAHFSEAIHSYITDERVGFAEPVPGVELYLCPSHPKITTILAHNLSKELLDSINSVANGLVGIVVWRRPHATISPRVSSHHHRHGGSKKHSSSKKRHESMNHSFRRNPTPLPNDEDDVPPGFGPPIVREDDDLPEFDFSRGGSSHQAGALAVKAMATAPPSSSHHMRELIQKYGQGESVVSELGIPVEPWNEEDDIPEWNPNQNTRPPPPLPMLPPPPLPMLPPPPPPPHVYQQQHINTHPFAINQNLMPPQFIPFPPPTPIQPQVGGMQPNNVPWRPFAQGMPDGHPRPCYMGGRLGSGRPPVSGTVPSMVQGFGGVRNGLGPWRPDNNNGSKGP